MINEIAFTYKDVEAISFIISCKKVNLSIVEVKNRCVSSIVER